jgi:hypothetical protein
MAVPFVLEPIFVKQPTECYSIKLEGIYYHGLMLPFQQEAAHELCSNDKFDS